MSGVPATSQSLTNAVPPRWTNSMRPFMQRADEFASHEPAVAYYLRRYVVFTCMKDRPKDDHACTVFLTQLLTQLQGQAETLGAQAKDEFGKTLMNTFAMKLFMRADEAERSGSVTLSTVRLFFTSAILMQSTAQFNKDEVMQAEMASKCKYAKYTAAKIKKALDAHVPYISPNAHENNANQINTANYSNNNSHEAISNHNNSSNNNTDIFNTANNIFNAGYNQSTDLTNRMCDDLHTQLHPSAPPVLPDESGGNDLPPFPPRPFAAQIDFNNIFTHDPASDSNGNNTQTFVLPDHAYNPPDNLFNQFDQNAPAQNNFPVITSDTGLRLSPPASSARTNSHAQVPQMTMAQAVALRPARKLGGPSVEAMIDAQKFARQAVSALQFYDHENAIKQLHEALHTLGQ